MQFLNFELSICLALIYQFNIKLTVLCAVFHYRIYTISNSNNSFSHFQSISFYFPLLQLNTIKHNKFSRQDIFIHLFFFSNKNNKIMSSYINYRSNQKYYKNNNKKTTDKKFHKSKKLSLCLFMSFAKFAMFLSLGVLFNKSKTIFLISF